MALTSRALAFASRWFDEATVSRTFEPLIADWQREWHDAPVQRRPWVLIRGWLAFVCAAIVSSPEVVRTPVPPALRNRVAMRIGLVVSILSAIMLVPFLLDQYRVELPGERRQAALLFFALISTIASAFPFAMAAAVDAIRHDHPPPHAERSAALKLGVFAVAFMLLYGGWVVPAANQAWRTAMAPPGTSMPLRGTRELNTLELIFDSSRATVYEPGTALASKATSVRRELNNRVALIALPIVLICLRWRAWDSPRRRWVRSLPAIASTPVSIVAFFGLFFTGFWLEHEFKLWAGSGFWLPILAFALWGLSAPHVRRGLLVFAIESPAEIR